MLGVQWTVFYIHIRSQRCIQYACHCDLLLANLQHPIGGYCMLLLLEHVLIQSKSHLQSELACDLIRMVGRRVPISR
ncbi:hypothetical protein D1872_335430 [compost metagenome]